MWQPCKQNPVTVRTRYLQGEAMSNHIICLQGERAVFIRRKQHGLHCLLLHYQHICRSGRFYCVYAFTYCNELLIICSKFVKWVIRACGHFHQGTQSLFLFYGSCFLPFSFTYYTQVFCYLKMYLTKLRIINTMHGMCTGYRRGLNILTGNAI